MMNVIMAGNKGGHDKLLWLCPAAIFNDPAVFVLSASLWSIAIFLSAEGGIWKIRTSMYTDHRSGVGVMAFGVMEINQMRPEISSWRHLVPFLPSSLPSSTGCVLGISKNS